MKRFNFVSIYLIIFTLFIIGCSKNKEEILTQQNSMSTSIKEKNGIIQLGTDITITGATPELRVSSETINPNKLNEIDRNITQAKKLIFVNLKNTANVELTLKINNSNKNLLNNINIKEKYIYAIAKYINNSWKVIGDFYPSTAKELKANIILAKSTNDSMIIAVIAKNNSNKTNKDWTAPSGYYSSIYNQKGVELKSALNDIIDNHTKLSYKDVWRALQKTDQDINNKNNVILLYTGNSVNGPKQYNNGKGWNREHVWAKSHGNFGTAKGPGTDLHHLRPADIRENSNRGNKEFDIKTTSSTYEPRDEIKGDIARMIFYMATRYEGEHGEVDLKVIEDTNDALKNPTHGKLSTLLKWHKNDPVDDWERRRNDIIYNEFQHNRNPFIDNPQWVNDIWDN